MTQHCKQLRILPLHFCVRYSEKDAVREHPLGHVQLGCDRADGRPVCQLVSGGKVGCPAATGRVVRSACPVCLHASKPLAHSWFFRCLGLCVRWMDSGIPGLQIKYNFEVCLGFLKKLSILISRLSPRDLCHQHGWAIYCMPRWKGRELVTCLLNLRCLSVPGSQAFGPQDPH